MADQDFHDSFFDEEAPQPANVKPPVSAAQKAQNILALGREKSTKRVIIATVAGVIVVGCFLVATFARKKSDEDRPVPASMTGADVGMAPQATDDGRLTGMQSNPQYQAMAAALAASQAAEAMRNGVSAQPNAVTVEASLTPVKTPEETEVEQEKARVLADRRMRAEAAAAAASAAAAAEAQSRQSIPPSLPDGLPPDGGQMAMNQQTGSYQRSSDRVAELRAKMKAIIDRAPAGPQVFSFASGPTPAESGGVGAGQGAGTTVASATQSQAQRLPDQPTLIEAGAIIPMRIDTAVNTSRGKTFRGTLLTGKLAGSTVTGTYTRQDEVADLTVTTINTKQYGAVPAQGAVLDGETFEQGVASDVDRKLLVRYGIKPLASGFAALADYLKNQSTTVVVNGTTVATSTPELTGKRAGQIIAGSAAQAIAGDTEALDTTKVVRVYKGTIVGLFITSDVKVPQR